MELYILTLQFELLGIVDNYSSTTFTRNYCKMGVFQIVIDNNTESAKLLIKDRIVMINKDGKRTGIIKSVAISVNEEGNETRTVTGFTLGFFLSQRVTLPVGEFDYAVGLAEPVMRDYVDRNLINPFDNKRKIASIVHSENKNLGERIQWQTRYENLLTVIESISDIFGIGWHIYLDLSSNKFIFDVYEGKNLSIHQEVLPPVVFSTDYENVQSQSYLESSSEEKNFGYVAGEGEGVDRRIYLLGDATGLDRKEVFLEVNLPKGKDEEIVIPTENNQEVPLEEPEVIDPDAPPVIEEEIEYVDVVAQGRQMMKDFTAVVNLESDVVDTKMYVFERDYDLGDIVTVQNKSWNVTKDLRISSVTEYYQNDEIVRDFTFGDAIPSLSERVKKEIGVFKPYIHK